MYWVQNKTSCCQTHSESFYTKALFFIVTSSNPAKMGIFYDNYLCSGIWHTRYVIYHMSVIPALYFTETDAEKWNYVETIASRENTVYEYYDESHSTSLAKTKKKNKLRKKKSKLCVSN